MANLPLPPAIHTPQVLADPNFVTSLKTYDKDNVKPAIIDRIRKEYTSNPEFTPANAAKASSAAEVWNETQGFIWNTL